jgi:two-component system, NarL family, nitrate/nitrite response regulator NarL
MGTHLTVPVSRSVDARGSDTRIAVALVMAFPLGADAMAAAFRPYPDLDVVCTTTDPSEPLGDGIGADVLVLDLSLGIATILEILRRDVRGKRARALVLVGYPRASSVATLRRHGASGLIHKTRGIDDAAAAIRIVHKGGSTFENADAQKHPDHQTPSLRELELLDQLRRGASNSEIAQALGISVRTVESHLRRLFARYGTASRSELLMLALKHDWVRLESQ